MSFVCSHFCSIIRLSVRTRPMPGGLPKRAFRRGALSGVAEARRLSVLSVIHVPFTHASKQGVPESAHGCVWKAGASQNWRDGSRCTPGVLALPGSRRRTTVRTVRFGPRKRRCGGATHSPASRLTEPAQPTEDISLTRVKGAGNLLQTDGFVQVSAACVCA